MDPRSYIDILSLLSFVLRALYVNRIYWQSSDRMSKYIALISDIEDLRAESE